MLFFYSCGSPLFYTELRQISKRGRSTVVIRKHGDGPMPLSGDHVLMYEGSTKTYIAMLRVVESVEDTFRTDVLRLWPPGEIDDAALQAHYARGRGGQVGS